MRGIIIFLMIVLSNNLSFAQTTAVDNLFDKYGYEDGFTTVFISKYMFELFSKKNVAEDDSEDMQDAISGLESIRILTMDDENENTSINFFKEIGKQIPFENYNMLMVVKEKDQELRMMTREVDGKIVEFLMLGGGNDNLLISILGKIDMESIAKISESIDIDGLKNLEKLEEK